MLGFPFARFRVLPSTDFAARIDDAITAGNDADAQKFVLRLAVPGACAAFLVLVLVSPGLTALAGATLIILFGAQYALTRAFETCVRFENTQAPRILRTRNLLASHLPGLRSLGALDWALDVGRVAANEELTARAHSEVLRLSDESLRRFGPIFVVLAIVISLAAGAGRNLTFSSLSVILFSGLWLGSEVCRVASAWAGLREANKRTPAQSSLMEPEPAMPPQQSRLGEIATVVFERASFVYSGAAQPSLEDVSFELRKGDCVAVVGPSGSGKTTLVRLLTGLEHPTHGKIRVNGFDLRVADVADYRRRVGAVFQDQHVEVATIRRTILGTTPIPEEQAWAAARLARISDRIASLPMGMQTLVARATVPSAMVNQLLIARALVRRPEILVFDEALSNLDETVQSGLIADLQAAGTMVVICTHRPSTMALATRVIRLEHGRMLP
ncbi:MAG: ABC transporter ATP-binding protein [Acidipila sp.]|nr:ABC transporter ATP-binding protein [Acidipila sp.]